MSDNQYGINSDAIQAAVSSPSSAKSPYEYLDGLALGEQIALDDARKIRLEQVFLKRILEENEEQEIMLSVLEKMRKKFDNDKIDFVDSIGKPGAYFDSMCEAKPELFKNIEAEAKSAGFEVFRSAGFSQDEINALPSDFVSYMGTSYLHEKSFPVEGPSLAERLTSAKPQIISYIKSGKALNHLGLAVSCATGGIVFKAGMKGIGFLLGKLGENPSVRAFNEKVADKTKDFVSKATGMTKEDLDKKAKKFFESKSFKVMSTVAIVGVLGVAIVAGSVDYNDVEAFVDKVKENTADLFADVEFSENLNRGVDGSINMDATAPSSTPAPSDVAGEQEPTRTRGSIANANAGPDTVPAEGVAEQEPTRTRGSIAQGSAVQSPSETELTADANKMQSSSNSPASLSVDDMGSPDDSSLASSVSDSVETNSLSSDVQAGIDTAAENEGAPVEATTLSYEVEKDDNISDIGTKLLIESGIENPSAAQIKEMEILIIQMNAELVGDNPHLIHPGWVLDIPNLNASVLVPEATVDQFSCPPVAPTPESIADSDAKSPAFVSKHEKAGRFEMS